MSAKKKADQKGPGGGGQNKSSSRAKGSAKKGTSSAKRLRPGGLDEIVMGDLKAREADWPLTATAIGKSVGRSSGAVANCLARLKKAERVHQAKSKPRSYDLKGIK
jgi:hypothetical protein